MKRLLLLSFMLLAAVGVVAQSRVTGRVLIGGISVLGATVVATTGDEACQSGESGEDGTFALQLEQGEYDLKIDFLSHKTWQQKIVVEGDMDLGDIQLELEDKYKDMMIRTPWGYFDDLAADAADNGIMLAAPAGFKKWNSGYSRGAFYACRLHSEDGEVELMFSPIQAIDHLRIFDVRGEKIVAYGGRRLTPPEEQSSEAVELLYAQCLKNATNVEYLSRKECRRLNIDKGYVAYFDYDGKIFLEKYTNQTNVVLKKGDVIFSFSVRMTDKAKKQEKKYLKSIYGAIRFE